MIPHKQTHCISIGTVMIRNDIFVLAQINGDNLILPSGQAVVDFVDILEINKTGAFVWELLKNDLAFSELIEKLYEKFDVEASQKYVFEKEVFSFICALKSRGMILDNERTLQGESCINLKIAGLKVRLFCPLEYINDNLLAFRYEDGSCEFSSSALEIYILNVKKFSSEKLTCLLKNKDLVVLESSKEYVLIYPQFDCIKEVHINKENHKTYIYLKSSTSLSSLREEIFLCLRTPFLFFAESKNYFMLHSVSALYKGKAYLFSAKSGGGKTTIGNFFSKEFDAPIINGDLNLLNCNNDEIFVSGTPWCGTSNVYSNETYPLGGIFFIEKSTVPSAVKLGEKEAAIFLYKANIMPGYTQIEVSKNLKKAILLSKKITCVRFNTINSVKTLKAIEEYI